jgi:hypothetical protein
MQEGLEQTMPGPAQSGCGHTQSGCCSQSHPVSRQMPPRLRGGVGDLEHHAQPSVISAAFHSAPTCQHVYHDGEHKEQQWPQPVPQFESADHQSPRFRFRAPHDTTANPRQALESRMRAAAWMSIDG